MYDISINGQTIHIAADEDGVLSYLKELLSEMDGSPVVIYPREVR